MNKLVSKNSILRFKLGKKIIKYQNAGSIRFTTGDKKLANNEVNPKPRHIPRTSKLKIPSSTNSVNWLTKFGKFGKFANKIGKFSPYAIVGSIIGDRLGTYARNQYEKSEYERAYNEGMLERLRAKDRLGLYLFENKDKMLGPDLSQIDKPYSNTRKQVTPIDNYYVKGFGGNGLKDEITKAGGVKAMLKKLIEMGLLKDKFGADGRWGRNTQEAYNKYKQMLAPGLPTAEEAGPIEKAPVELRTPIIENVPMGYGASLALAANKLSYTNPLFIKRGGLISKNPIKRFKEGSSFGKAFRQARNSGLKEFTWNGKRYTTELKEEKEAREKKQSPKINNNDHSPLDMKKKSIKKDGKEYAYTKNGNLREIKNIYF